MIYDWDFESWLAVKLKASMRQPTRTALYVALLEPLRELYAEFLTIREKVEFDVGYSMETISIEHMMNTLFDPNLKRINIVTNDDVLPRVFTFQDGENTLQAPDVFAGADGEVLDPDPVFLFADDEVINTADYTVSVPNSVWVTHETAIRARLDRYRIAGKKYEIELI